MVAVLLILVETVLIPAAKMEAMSNPVTPAGNPFTINQGKTLSPEHDPESLSKEGI